jgi:hypothetical protein
MRRLNGMGVYTTEWQQTITGYAPVNFPDGPCARFLVLTVHRFPRHAALPTQTPARKRLGQAVALLG